MTYQTIKTIKGRQYLYEQTSFRENGKVKTVSRYICPVDSSGNIKPSDPILDQEAQTTNQVDEVLIQESNSPTVSTPEPEQKLTLQIKADLRLHKIGQSSLTNEYKNFIRHLQGRGLKIKAFPKISILTDSMTRLKGFSGGHEIHVPAKNKEGARAKFWREFRKTTSEIYLNEIEKQDPKYFSGLKLNLEKSFKQQNKAIASYIMQSKRNEFFKIGLTLHFLYSKMVSQWTQSKLKPEKIGFSGYADRPTWKKDAILIMAEIQKDGWQKCYEKYSTELGKTQNSLFYLLKKYQKTTLLEKLSGKRRAIRRDIRKINARRRAVCHTCDKISMLAPLYDGFCVNFKGLAVRPFQHDEDWKRQRQQWKIILKKS